MKNADSHIVLYAKLHYKVSAFMDDLKILVAHRSGIEAEYINDWTVLEVVACIAIPFIRNKYQWIEIIKDASKGECMKLSDLIHRLVFGVLQGIQVKAKNGKIIYELDEPDYSILPKR